MQVHEPPQIRRQGPGRGVGEPRVGERLAETPLLAADLVPKLPLERLEIGIVGAGEGKHGGHAVLADLDVDRGITGCAGQGGEPRPVLGQRAEVRRLPIIPGGQASQQLLCGGLARLRGPHRPHVVRDVEPPEKREQTVAQVECRRPDPLRALAEQGDVEAVAPELLPVELQVVGRVEERRLRVRPVEVGPLARREHRGIVGPFEGHSRHGISGGGLARRRAAGENWVSGPARTACDGRS